MSKSPITCHVLDAFTGKPAAGVECSLECLTLDNLPDDALTKDLPSVLASGVTNSDGRCTTLLSSDFKVSPGTYKMVFQTGAYFEARSIDTFYPIVEITFRYNKPEQHYHIPLLVSPFSYTTYRGS